MKKSLFSAALAACVAVIAAQSPPTGMSAAAAREMSIEEMETTTAGAVPGGVCVFTSQCLSTLPDTASCTERLLRDENGLLTGNQCVSVGDLCGVSAPSLPRTNEICVGLDILMPDDHVRDPDEGETGILGNGGQAPDPAQGLVFGCEGFNELRCQSYQPRRCVQLILPLGTLHGCDCVAVGGRAWVGMVARCRYGWIRL